ncbi:hypothetical protein [Planctomyces sp. SH-PL14]|uniref:hypothetical protein n=1 Tax=Planctomyces sp. SH-PL14 TaxID=1632864 RepID=UPI00078B7343|nr:hypothetical protein [Planctomyces sp. SH-PL14]AMV21684.1 hypothetical protein VT03_27530 [Planctomyces sp. SH-PL14]
MPSAMPISDADLLAFLDEMLPGERAAAVEQELRGSAALQQRAAQLLRKRDQGGQSLGEIWRRHRLSCPTRAQLSDFVTGVLTAEWSSYIQFHLYEVGCAVCTANLTDLERASASESERAARTKRFYDSSAGKL